MSMSLRLVQWQECKVCHIPFDMEEDKETVVKNKYHICPLCNKIIDDNYSKDSNYRRRWRRYVSKHK